MPAPEAGDPVVVARLELVVALLDDPLGELRQHLPDLEPGHQLAQQRRQEAQVPHVGLDGLGDPRVLDLDGDLAPLGGAPPVDLADAGGGRRFWVDRVQDPLRGRSPLLRDHLPHLLPADRRDVVSQRGQAALKVLALVGVEAGELDGREGLPGLHRRAAHHRELVDQRVDGGDDAIAAPAPLLLGRPPGVQPVARPAHRAAGRDPSQAGGAGASAPGRAASLLVCHGRQSGNRRAPPRAAHAAFRGGRQRQFAPR